MTIASAMFWCLIALMVFSIGAIVVMFLGIDNEWKKDLYRDRYNYDKPSGERLDNTTERPRPGE